MRRRGTFVALVAALLSSAALVGALRVLAPREARRALETVFEPRVWAGRVRLDVPGGRLRVAPVTLRDRATERLLARVEDLVVDLGFGLAGPRIERVRLNHPEVFRWAPLLRAGASSGALIPTLSVQDGTLHFQPPGGNEILLEQVQLDLRRTGDGAIRGPGMLAFPGGALRFVATVNPWEARVSGSALFRATSHAEIARFDPREDLRVDVRAADGDLEVTFWGPRFSARIPGTEIRIEAPQGIARLRESGRDADLLARVAGGTMRLAGDLSRADSEASEILVDVRGIRLGPETATLGSLDTTVRDVAEGLRPSGTADFRGRLLLEGGRLRAVEGEAELRDVDLRVDGFVDPESGERIGFPLPGRIRRGRVTLGEDRLWIHDVEGEIGGGELTFVGEVFSLAFPGLDLEARVRGMRVGPGVREALASVPGAQEAFDAVSPTGSADVSVRIARPAGEPRVHATVRIEPRGGSVRWEGFPVLVENLEGIVEIEPERIEMDLRGRACGGEVEVRGAWRGPRAEGDPLPGIDLEVRARGLEPTAEFLEALAVFAPETRAVVRPGEASGSFDLEIHAVRARGATDPDPSLRVLAQLDGVNAPVAGSPFRAGEVRGDLVVSRKEGRATVVAEGLRGTLGTAQGAPAFASLELRALSVPLDEGFVDALREGGMQGVPEDLFLSGAIDLELLSRRGAGPNDDRATVRLRSVDVRSSEPRLAFENLDGVLEAGPSGLRAERLRAIWAGAPVLLEEVEVVPGERKTTVSFRLRAEGIPLREESWSNLPPAVAEAMRALALRGTVDLAATRVTVELAADAEPAISIEGEVRLRSVSVGGGLALEDVQGVARVEALRIDASGVTGRGSVEAASARAAGRAVDGLRAEFEIAGAEVRIPRFFAQVAGGSWSEGEGDAFRLRLDAPRRIDLSLSYRDVDLGRFLAQAIPRSGDLAGTLSGGLRLSGPPGDPRRMTGGGVVSVADGALGAIPVFRNLYDFLQIGSRPVFRSGFVRFSLGAKGFRFEEVELSSPLLEIRARGTLGFDGELDVRLDSSLFPLLPDLLLVTDLWRFFKRQFVSFRLHGPVENPHVRVENLLLGVLAPPPRVKRLPYVPAATPGPTRRPPWF